MEILAPLVTAFYRKGRSCLRSILLLMVILLVRTEVWAQRVTENNGHLWVSHWGDHRISEHWSFHTEAHWRRANLGRDGQQLLLRPAINYHLNEQVMFTAGYSYYINYPYDTYPIPFSNWEHHLFQQVQLTNPIGRLRIQHRFRIEERFVARIRQDTEDPTIGEFDGYNYLNRFRYRLWLTLPLGHEQSGPGVFTVNLYDEFFLNFGEPGRLNNINQNRLSALVGYQVNKPLNVMIGYLLQDLQRPGAANGNDLVEMNSTLHFVLVYNLDLRRQARQNDGPK
ncbi:MAG TPA: DUF2490 domain-containing protein [Flavobacteriales bacterium]|nr:DUF2490 domain-containing protein [Flavobacteriales bacterium]HQV75689.1 DUF2490 domain-containing protein [Flavobacteriales bacterium]